MEAFLWLNWGAKGQVEGEGGLIGVLGEDFVGGGGDGEVLTGVQGTKPVDGQEKSALQIIATV